MRLFQRYNCLLAAVTFTLLNTSASSTALWGTRVDYLSGDGPVELATADLDQDGDIDVAATDWNSNVVSVHFNDGTGSLGGAVNYVVGSRPISIWSADFDSDGDSDLAVAKRYSDISILTNDGNGVFSPAVGHPAGTGPRAVSAADFDADGNLDLVVANADSDDITILFGAGDCTFGAPVSYASGDYAGGVVPGDLDGDGDMDLAVTNEFAHSVSIFLNSGDGSFAAAVTYAVGAAPRRLAVGDFDGDDSPDILTANGESNDISLLFNTGDGTFGVSYSYSTDLRPASVVAGDLDHDGDLDVAVANSDSHNIAVFSNNGSGPLQLDRRLATGSRCHSVICLDIDQDGSLDLLTANRDSDNITVWYGSVDCQYSLYQTDFAADPDWVSNASTRYYWDRDTETYFADTYTNSGEYATTSLDYGGESFRLTFSVRPVRDFSEPGNWTGDVNVGLFGPSRVSNSASAEERLYVLIGGYGSQVYFEGYNSGAERIYTGAGSGIMQLDTWHDVEMTYDAEQLTLQLDVSIHGTSVLNERVTMNYGFSNQLSFLGVSSVGSWIASDRRQLGYIDDVSFEICPSLPVALDIKPGSCPNPLNVKAGSDVGGDHKHGNNASDNGDPGHQVGGVLPAAVMGTPDFDVADIDPNTVTLSGVPLLRYAYCDVGTPVDPAAPVCACPPDGSDGFVDLTVKFDLAAIVGALGPVETGEVIELTLTGELYDGTPIRGSDCIFVVGHPKDVDEATKGGSLPTEYALHQNHPNPFNPTTEISYSLKQAGEVRLDVFNMLGQRVATLFEGYSEAGDHTVAWDASAQASGVYLYRLTAGEFVETKKMTLLK